MRTQEPVKASQEPNRSAKLPHAHPRHDDPRSREAALLAVNVALEKKALEPVLLDVRELASYCDYILIVSGRSDRQVQAIGDAIVEEFAKDKRRPLGVEGIGKGQWTLIDFGDLIVHVFYHPARDYYDLESLWIDAARVPLEVPPSARVQPGEGY
ncbi:MAG: ribosome silencing factor [Deltaproteobacteria bacterium]|nr:ribosome silencing factor [Deltaproteobacteria bacterium]